MTLDFLLKAFRKQRQHGEKEVNGNQLSRHSLEDEKQRESADLFNPFPEPIAIEFRDVIDLHSIPARQVRAVVEEYLEEAHRRGVRWVRIIHGKGMGVQREMVRSILARTRFVEEFRDAPPEAGGWGATLVTLANRETGS